ncbi:hypothetical protein [Burkholderia gladioli]|nr:hypothetical protein [Burkholderia gladioli]
MNMSSKSNNEYDDDMTWSIASYEPLVFVEHNGEIGYDFLDVEHSIARDVDYITQVVKRLLRTTSPLFAYMSGEAIRSRRPNGRSIKETKGGEVFLRCFEIDFDRILDKYPNLAKYNRYFAIFLDAVTHEVEFAKGMIPLSLVIKNEWLVWRDRLVFSEDTLVRIARYLNEAVVRIRVKGNGKDFKTWMTDIERQPRQNEESLLSLVEACLSVNHHALVLRFDLGYAQFYGDAQRSGLMAVSYREVREHRVRMRRFLKRELKHRLLPGACKGMVFAIKLEYGLDKGYHFHVIVMLNGDVVWGDGAISEMICDYWRHEITQGRGGACNCNFMRYKRRGIGSIRYSDVDKLPVLRTVVVPYITKVDYYRDMVVPKWHRTFWSSHSPKVEAVPKGRKRKVVGEGADSE